MKPAAPTAISLFAGIGGFDLAFEKAGFKILAQVENDKHCRTLLKSKFPDAQLFGDIRDVTADHLPDCQVVTFGSPCQDLSIAGRRKGLNGQQSILFYEATRIIQSLASRGLEFVLWENVPGVFSSNGGLDFAAVLAALADCGAMDIAWRILDSQYWGLAQRRKRVFLVADFRAERAAEILALSQSLQGDSPPRRETQQNVAPTLQGRAGKGGVGDFEMSGGCSGQDMNHGHSHLIAYGGNNCSSSLEISTAINACPASSGRMDFESETYVAYRTNAAGQIDNQGDKSAALTQQTYPCSQFVLHAGVRRLTPTECERLMGFPYDYTKGFCDSTRYRLLGNAVCPPVAKWLAEKIVLALS